jgi:DNA-directed RNA polymerase subunit beta
VRVGDRVEEGQILCDGPATEKGEMALGSNVLAAFLPWRGYNYEDAIVLSERLVKDSVFDSVYIVEESVEVRETKLGKEEVTRDIPGVSENVLKNLDETGIVRVGAKVQSGDILIGKVTPKGESQLTPEEKLLKAIFGEQASEIKDTSLYCPPGVEGTVVDVKIFTRRGIDMDERSEEIFNSEIEKLNRNFEDERIILVDDKYEKIRRYLVNVKAKKVIKLSELTLKKNDSVKLPLGFQLSDSSIALIKKGLAKEDILEIVDIENKVKKHINSIQNEIENKVNQIKKGEEFEPGIIKIIKVLIAKNRKISVGDKMAGRHGNKGCVAKILPIEDMPFLDDGTPIDIVLNPLGVPSRMNVGQLYELILGWAGLKLGKYFQTHVFDGATNDDVKEYMKKAGLPEDGKVNLFDGISGEKFNNKVTVGCMYIMKLEHMVEDKIHARSTGPYSLITQQPLGGKAQFGGQRVGEMEVWAFEAYGAAHILQELLTIKSDNVEGRNKIYSAIVKGNMEFQPGIPESFNVLLKELKSLALNVQLIKKQKKTEEGKIKENITKIS